MSEHKVPAGWAKPEAPKPRQFSGSLWAGLVAFLLVGAGIAWVVLKGQAQTHVEPRADVPTNVHDEHIGDHRKSKEHREPDDHPDDPSDPSAHIVEDSANVAPDKPDVVIAAPDVNNSVPDAASKADALPKTADVGTKPTQDDGLTPAQDDTIALDNTEFAIAVLPIDRATQKWLNRANEHLKAERFKSAIFDFRRVLKIDKNVAVAHRGIGIAYARLNKPKYARKAYLRYLELDPDAEDAPDVRRLLGQ